ncbi:hypothetical protein ABIA30_002362 [Mycobacterium sp. MAA66]|uniref:hypothetical protein n=1 Tax=Mycobacterium sp. MAA66 TaxID=3156297 RepID=UPI0035150CDF
MSWLLVVCIPGLLMLATFGLSRLEARLDATSETMSAADVAVMLKKMLEKTKAACAASTTPSNSLPHRAAPREPQRALPQRDTALDMSNYVLPCSAPEWDRTFEASSEPELPGPAYARGRGNPQFRQTRHANRV